MAWNCPEKVDSFQRAVPAAVRTPNSHRVRLDAFDRYALELLDDGRITIDGHETNVAMIHIVDPAVALLPGHTIDPMLWDTAPASEPLLELGRLDA